MNEGLARAQTQRRTRKRQSRAQQAAARRSPVGKGVLAPKRPVLFRSAPTTTSLKDDSRKKLRRAIVALPKTPTPSLPLIKNPTRAQQGAAGRLIAKAQAEARGGLTGSAGLAAQRAYEQSLRDDPRQASYRHAVSVYTAAATRDLQRTAGREAAKRAGVTRRLTDTEANELGREALEHHDTYRALAAKKGLRGGLSTATILATHLLALGC